MLTIKRTGKKTHELEGRDEQKGIRSKVLSIAFALAMMLTLLSGLTLPAGAAGDTSGTITGENHVGGILGSSGGTTQENTPGGLVAFGKVILTGADISGSDLIAPDFWAGIGFSGTGWRLEAGGPPLLLVNLSAQRPDYRLNGVDGDWDNGDITMDTDGDKLVILADSGPDAAVKIDVTAPDNSSVTISGQEGAVYENVYITAANDNITLALAELCITAPHDQIGLTLSGGGTIEDSGACSVEGGEKTSANTQPRQLSAGIYSYGDLTVSGASMDDVLTATGGSSGSSGFSPDGIVVQGSITISEITAEFYGSEGTSGNALGGYGVYLTEGTLHSTHAYAVFTDGDSQDAIGGMGIVIYMASLYRDVEIENSEIEAYGGDGVGGGYGINTGSSIFSLTGGSSLVAVGGDGTGTGGADNGGDEIRAITDTGSIVVDDSLLYATGGNNENHVGGNGMLCLALTLTNGAEVNALGGDSNRAGNGGIGVYAYFGTEEANVSVGDNCALTATGGGGLQGAAGAGLLCDAIEIAGGTVDSFGGDSQDANGGIGLRSLTGNVAITGGITTPTTPKVTIVQPDGGSIEASPINPATGEEVLVTVTPEEGNEVGSVTVTDKNGNQLDVTKRDDGACSFIYGGSAVTIEAELIPLSSGHDCPSEHLVDVDQSKWYHETIDYVIVNQIMQGTSATTFEPDAHLTRDMMDQMLYNLEGRPAAGTSSFTDVDEIAWYADAAAWAEASGVVMGVSSSRFAPDDLATREQMAAMHDRYCGHKGIELPVIRESGGFADGDLVSGFAAQAVDALYKAGVLNGKGDDMFDPQGTATRAEVAQMFMNFMEAIK